MSSSEIRATKKYGNGLFALKAFSKNQTILQFQGKKVSRQEAMDADRDVSDLYFQIGEALYLDLGGDSSLFINHSCNPNCMIKVVAGTAFLVALRTINKDDEMTFDYSTTSNETADTWMMECRCYQFNCRKIITGAHTLKEKDRNFYKIVGALPNYINNI